MRTTERIVRNPSGIHLRPAAVFVKAAAGFASKVTLENLELGKAPVDAKSMISVMTAGARQGHLVRIAADGPDEDAAIEALEGLLDDGLGEVVPG